MRLEVDLDKTIVLTTESQRKLLEALPEAELKPNFTSLSKKLNMPVSTVYEAWKKLEAQFFLTVRIEAKGVKDNAK